jgi:tetratricopeptide (TPR) repeat protein
MFRQWERANEAPPAEAARIGESLVAQDPRNRVFRSAYANALSALGDAKRAIALYRESVALAPNDADAWYDLASALREAGNDAEALTVIDQSLRLDPNRAESHNIRGVVLLASNPSAALAEFAEAIRLDPKNARAHTNMGNALRAAGRIDEAAGVYERALEIDPQFVDALNGLGVIQLQAGRGAQALPLFDRALEVQPDFHEARLNRAIALNILGDRKNAIAELNQLLQTAPRNDPIRSAAGQLLKQLGH